MGFGDYAPFEFRITEIRFELGLREFAISMISQFGITTPFDIGITELHSISKQIGI